MISLLRTVLTAIVVFFATMVYGMIAIVGAALGAKHREGSLLDRIPRLWSRAILWAAGVTVRVHGIERLRDANGVIRGSYIFASNHVSHFDIPALECALPHHYFIAKAELFKVPVFGPGIRAVGTIPIQRTNQKAAFGSYNIAAERIREGVSVVVFPEGTRGTTYSVRPFKKGPFVLAVEAGVPIVPCIIHGTIDVLPKKSLRIHPGIVDVHMLEPVPTAGLSYADRDQLARTVNERMSSAMNTIYPNT
jgi:1-acyl-sn-glycerol-3-phosphate acyltransferase